MTEPTPRRRTGPLVVPDDATRAKLAELATFHDQWSTPRLDSTPFRPEDHTKPGGDYNLHYVDVDGDDEAFHEGAARIFAS